MGQWNTSWHHLALGIPAFWEQNLTGKDVTVALLDTGLAAPTGLDRTDFEYLDSQGQKVSAWDSHGHGTCCGSVIASYLGGALGIAPYCKIVSMRVLETGTTIQDVEDALTYIARQRPDVDIVSCSFILSALTPGITEAIRRLSRAGQVIIGAAGDSNLVASPFPEQTQNAVKVAALDEDDQPLPGARIGRWVDVAAPGKDIPVLLPSDGLYGLFSESSAAAAVASGVLALVLSGIADRTARRRFAGCVESLVRSTATSLPNAPPNTVGPGRISPAALLASIPP